VRTSKADISHPVEDPISGTSYQYTNNEEKTEQGGAKIKKDEVHGQNLLPGALEGNSFSQDVCIIKDQHATLVVRVVPSGITHKDLGQVFEKEPGFLCATVLKQNNGIIKFDSWENAERARGKMDGFAYWTEGLKVSHLEKHFFEYAPSRYTKDQVIKLFINWKGFIFARCLCRSNEECITGAKSLGVVGFDSEKNASKAMQRMIREGLFVVPKAAVASNELRAQSASPHLDIHNDISHQKLISTSFEKKQPPYEIMSTSRFRPIFLEERQPLSTGTGKTIILNECATSRKRATCILQKTNDKGADDVSQNQAKSSTKDTSNNKNSPNEAVRTSKADISHPVEDPISGTSYQYTNNEEKTEQGGAKIKKDEVHGQNLLPGALEGNSFSQDVCIIKDQHATLVVRVVPSGITHKDLGQVFEKEPGFLCATVLKQNNGIIKFDSWENAERARGKMDGFAYWTEGLKVSHLEKHFFEYAPSRYTKDQVIKLFINWKGFIFARCLCRSNEECITGAKSLGVVGFDSEKNASKAMQRMIREGLFVVPKAAVASNELRAQSASPHLDSYWKCFDISNEDAKVNKIPFESLLSVGVRKDAGSMDKSPQNEAGYANDTTYQNYRMLSKGKRQECNTSGNDGTIDNQLRTRCIDLTENNGTSFDLMDQGAVKPSDQIDKVENECFGKDRKNTTCHSNNINQSVTVDSVNSDDDPLIDDISNDKDDVIVVEKESSEEIDDEFISVVKTATPACLRLQRRRIAAQKRQKEAMRNRPTGPEPQKFISKNPPPIPKLKFRPKVPPKSKRICRSRSNSIASDGARSRSNSDSSDKSGEKNVSSQSDSSNSAKMMSTVTEGSKSTAQRLRAEGRSNNPSSKETSPCINPGRCTDDTTRISFEKSQPTVNQKQKSDLFGGTDATCVNDKIRPLTGKPELKENRAPFGFSKNSPSADQLLEEQERLLRASAAKVRYQKEFELRMQYAKSGMRSFSRPVEDLSKLPSVHWKWSDLYSRLGLPKASGEALVRRQYRRLALLYHPDKSKLKDAPERFQAIKEAYERLTNKFENY